MNAEAEMLINVAMATYFIPVRNVLRFYSNMFQLFWTHCKTMQNINSLDILDRLFIFSLSSYVLINN